MTRVLLLRHGQSTWNAEGRWQGQSDPPLSARGETDADAAAAQARAAFGGVDHGLAGLAAAVSSDLGRARRTAEIFAARFGWGPVSVLRELRERDVGEFTGRTRAEIDERWPGLLAAGPADPPGAEPWPSVLSRALAALRRIGAAHPTRAVLAVTHGGLIRSVEAHLGLTVARPPANLAGRWVELDGGRLRAGPSVELLANVTTG